jgi:hypothetical protein
VQSEGRTADVGELIVGVVRARNRLAVWPFAQRIAADGSERQVADVADHRAMVADRAAPR